jgi:multiple sugar transport system permease protein
VARSRFLPYALTAPALLALAVTVAYPIGFNIFASLHRWNLIESDAPEAFTGLGAFAAILADAAFWHALGVTVTIAVAAVAAEFALGLGLALLVNEDIHASRLIRTLLVAPIMATPLVVALIFRLMWHGEFGIINFGLSLVGSGPVSWLSQPHTALFAVIVTEVWAHTSFVFLVLLGALQMLPREPFEAARVDGARFDQQLRFITLPLLRPAILVALLFRTVFAIRMFDEIWVLTRGGPGDATQSISLLLYKAAFEVFDVSQAAAYSLTLLALTSVLAWLVIRVVYRGEG